MPSLCYFPRSADIPMLVAGDFNSEPGSAAHSLLVKRKVEDSMMDSIDQLKFLRDQKLSHSLDLASAYSQLVDAAVGDCSQQLLKQRQRMDPKTKEPMFTNLGYNYKGTLDYILYTSRFLQPTALLELPSESDVLCGSGDKPAGTPPKQEDHLPNGQYSSDHVALLAEFQYIRQ